MDLNDLRRREADLLKAMAKATTTEQTQLMADLAEVRSLRQAAIRGEAETDLANAVVQASLQPVASHNVRTTAALDWLGEVPTSDGAYDQAMAVEANLWFQRLDSAVKADAAEFATQAQGLARIHAGRYGEQAEAAERAFLDQALHLRRSAGLDKAALSNPMCADGWHSECSGFACDCPCHAYTIAEASRTAAGLDKVASTYEEWREKVDARVKADDPDMTIENLTNSDPRAAFDAGTDPDDFATQALAEAGYENESLKEGSRTAGLDKVAEGESVDGQTPVVCGHCGHEFEAATGGLLKAVECPSCGKDGATFIRKRTAASRRTTARTANRGVRRPADMDPDTFFSTVACARCAGKGWIDLGADFDFMPVDNTCPECKGSGLRPGASVASRKTAGDQVEMSEIPNCDIDASHGPAAYDARLPGLGGGWGYVCEACFQAYGPGRTGTGHAQRLVKREATKTASDDGDRAWDAVIEEDYRKVYSRACAFGEDDYHCDGSTSDGDTCECACHEFWDGVQDLRDFHHEYNDNLSFQGSKREASHARLGTGAPDVDHDPVIALLVSGQATTYQQAVALAEIVAQRQRIAVLKQSTLRGVRNKADKAATALEALLEEINSTADFGGGAYDLQDVENAIYACNRLIEDAENEEAAIYSEGSRRIAEVVDPWQDSLDEGHTADPAAADIPVDVDATMPNDDEWPDEQGKEDSSPITSSRVTAMPEPQSAAADHFWFLASDDDEKDPVEKAKDEGHSAPDVDVPVDVDATEPTDDEWPNEQGEGSDDWEDSTRAAQRRRAAINVFDDPDSARWCADCPWNEDRTGTRAAAYRVTGDGIEKYVCAEHAKVYDPSITASRRQAAGGFYVKRSRGPRPDYGPNDPPRSGWTGPIKSEEQAYKEKQAWEDSGWTAEVLPRSPEVDAEVRAWEKSVKEKQGAVVVDRQRAAAFRARVTQRKQAMDHGREVIWRVKGQDRDRSLWMRNDITDDEAMRRDIEGRWGVPADEIEIVSDSRTAQRRQAFNPDALDDEDPLASGGGWPGAAEDGYEDGYLWGLDGNADDGFASGNAAYDRAARAGLADAQAGRPPRVRTPRIEERLGLKGSRGRRPFVRRAGQRTASQFQYDIVDRAPVLESYSVDTGWTTQRLDTDEHGGAVGEIGGLGGSMVIGILVLDGAVYEWSEPTSPASAKAWVEDKVGAYLARRGARRRTAAEHVIPDGAGYRDFSPEQTLAQIGKMNVLSISGGRVVTITKPGPGGHPRPVGISLPVSNGYAVNVFLDADDTYIVQRVFRGAVKGEVRNVYMDEVGEMAYQAGMFRSFDFGGHHIGSRRHAADYPEPWCYSSSFHTDDLGRRVCDECGKVYTDEARGWFGDRMPPHSPPQREGSRRQAMPNPADFGVKVGDFFYTSWGYDQTNVEFYEVVGLTGASVRLREVAKDVDYQGSGSDHVTPRKGDYVGPEITKRLKDVGRPAVKINESATGWLWDGTPKYETAGGWGH